MRALGAVHDLPRADLAANDRAPASGTQRRWWGPVKLGIAAAAASIAIWIWLSHAGQDSLQNALKPPMTMARPTSFARAREIPDAPTSTVAPPTEPTAPPIRRPGKSRGSGSIEPPSPR
jgi:hypothetical protein